MLKKKLIRQYIKQNIKYSKTIIRLNLWIQIYIIIISKQLIYKKNILQKNLLFQTQEFVKNQN